MLNFDKAQLKTIYTCCLESNPGATTHCNMSKMIYLKA
jgi:hypothetical protein